MKPNILLITTDQHNAELLGAYGNGVIQTPHLDGIGESGFFFSSAFTPHPVCTPARTSILTGLLGPNHRVTYNLNLDEQKPDPPQWKGLAPDIQAFPEILKEAGYDTSLFGKLHTKQQGGKNFGISTMKLAEGKGHFVEDRRTGDDYRRHLRAKGYPDSLWRTWENPGYSDKAHTVCELPLDDYIDVWSARQAIDHLAAVREPFFCWVSFSGPHPAWDPPRPYDQMYSPSAIPMPHRRMGELEEKSPQFADAIAETIASTPPRSRDKSKPGGVENAYRRFPESVTREMLAACYGQITLIDEQVGKILDLLREQRRLENTLVIFTADHGDYCGNNWAFYKLPGLYDSLIRVPFLVRWEAGFGRPGKPIDALASLIDIAPTILEAAGAKPHGRLDGVSLLPLLQGRTSSLRERLLISSGRSRAVVTAGHLFMSIGGFEELYDRRNDPHNLYNLRSGADPSLLDELRRGST